MTLAPTDGTPHYHHTNAIQLSEEARIVCLRFGNDYTPECMEMDEMLYKIVDAVRDWVVIYVVDNKVPSLLSYGLSSST
jgi:DIM1 family U5 snRNP protein